MFLIILNVQKDSSGIELDEHARHMNPS